MHSFSISFRKLGCRISTEKQPANIYFMMHYLHHLSRTPPRNALPTQSTCPSRIHTHGLTAPFRFFSLPPEIRQEIIRYAATESQPIFIKYKNFNRHRKPQRKTRSGHLIDRREYVSPEKRIWGHSRMAILFTCRQAYVEGCPIYYGENTFNFTPEVFKHFHDEIPVRCVRQIRSIVMPFFYEHLSVWHLLANLESLRTLHLILSKLLTTLQPRQLEDCRKGVKMLPQLQKFRIDQRWLSQSSQGPYLPIIHKPKIDRTIIAAEEEINEYLRLRN